MGECADTHHECVHVRDVVVFEVWLFAFCAKHWSGIVCGFTRFYKMHSDLKSLHYITHLIYTPMYLILLIYVRNLY